MYTIYGPYFCLKWLLILSSFIWQLCVLLWKHPYLVAASIVMYGVVQIILYIIRKCTSFEGDVYDSNTVVMKLDSVEMKTEQLTEKTEQLTEEIANLTTALARLEERVVANAELSGPSGERDLTHVAYPLDRRRINAISRR